MDDVPLTENELAKGNGQAGRPATAEAAPSGQRAIVRAQAEPLLWDISDVAAALKISVKTCRRMAKCGQIPGLVRLGRLLRFDRRRISEWVANGCPRIKMWNRPTGLRRE